jgi:hypothetical protein
MMELLGHKVLKVFKVLLARLVLKAYLEMMEPLA